MAVNNFDLASTIESGQIFRFNLETHGGGRGYRVYHADKSFFVRQEGETLWYEGVDRAWLTHFFSIDRDLGKIHSMICRDMHVARAVKQFPGLRIIRQDPWECTIGFICSSASNIPKIKMNMELLCSYFGKDTTRFPLPGELNDISRITASKVGFRAKYIHAANQMLTYPFFESLRKLPYPAAKKQLMAMPGIGEKVADCILLFSLGFDQAFPVDTWVLKSMSRLYFYGREVTPQQVRGFAADRFGSYAGWAQQYLFHAERCRNKTNPDRASASFP